MKEIYKYFAYYFFFGKNNILSEINYPWNCTGNLAVFDSPGQTIYLLI